MKISCRNIDISKTLKELDIVLPKRKKQRIDIVCEIESIDATLVVKVLGAVSRCPAASLEHSKAILPLRYLSSMLEGWTDNDVEFDIMPGTLSFKHTTIESKKIKLLDPQEHKTISLSHNYKPLELITLWDIHSTEELDRVNIKGDVIKAMAKLEIDIKNAHRILSIYDVSIDDIYSLINFKKKPYNK